MRLLDLLYKVPEDTMVWISPSWQNEDECIYFGEAGAIPIRTAKGYEVSSLFPEKYPARYCTGITVIVTKQSD